MSKTEPPTGDLDTVFRECAGDLQSYFSRRHGGPEGADDLVQESFLQLARKYAAGRGISSPRAYLFGIARHVSLAFLRRREAAPERLDGVRDEPASREQPDPRAVAAREIIAALPPLQREILDLRFAHDLSYEEIATALGIPVGTVRSRLHHAVAQVRERLAMEDRSVSERTALRFKTYSRDEN